MTIGNSSRPSGMVWLAIAAMLLAPAGARAHRLMKTNRQAADSLQDPQELQDKEQERRDREQEARDRAQERLDRLQELYDDGREALDEDRYDQAESKFKQLADMNGPQTDAALYWKAYAQNRMGK